MSSLQPDQAVEEESPTTGAEPEPAPATAGRTRPQAGSDRDRLIRTARRDGRGPLRSLRRGRAPAGASWDERCAALFEDLRKPARVMVHRAFGSAFSPDEVEDVYANAWASTLKALRGREQSMDDSELRSYLLTAVANHASKEMRRRSRKPAGALDEVHSQVLADPHQLSPDERATGTETGRQARDVLASLPPRRRAVMLLRYGWGLEPKEVCRLVDGLSPRAYRKEITRGVEQMIERFRRLESGDWCETREPLIRDLVAGTADEEGRRQATEHISHCRRCGDLVNRLNSGLHELGGALGWTLVAGMVGAHRSVGERLAEALDRARDAASSTAGAAGDTATQAAQTAGGVASSGAGRGAGAVGAGILAKLAGIGAAGQLAIACLGAGAIGGACLATGLIEVPGGERQDRRQLEIEVAPGADAVAVRTGSLVAERRTELAVAQAATAARQERKRARARAEARAEAREAERAATLDAATDSAGAPAGSAAPAAPAAEQEFGLPSATATSPAASSPGPGNSGATAGDVAGEFGP